MDAQIRLSTAVVKRLSPLLAVVPVIASAQVISDPPRALDNEIPIYRDFLLHYPDNPTYMIGMQATTVAFVASKAFGEEPNPPDVQAPSYSGRKLPPEIMALTEEKAVLARAAAEGKIVEADPAKRNRFHLTLSEIAFDSAHQQAALVYSATCGCKGGGGGTVVYELKNGQWRRKGLILNAWIG